MELVSAALRQHPTSSVPYGFWNIPSLCSRGGLCSSWNAFLGSPHESFRPQLMNHFLFESCLPPHCPVHSSEHLHLPFPAVAWNRGGRRPRCRGTELWSPSPHTAGAQVDLCSRWTKFGLQSLDLTLKMTEAGQMAGDGSHQVLILGRCILGSGVGADLQEDVLGN